MFHNGRTRLIAGVTKCSIPLVELKNLRLAVAAAGRQSVHLRIDVTGNRDQIKPAVVVEIDESISPLQPVQRRQRDAGLVRHIVEVPIAIVAVKRVVLVGKIRDVQRRPAGVHVIAHSNAHASLLRSILAHRGPRLQANLLEFSVTCILVEIVGGGIVGDENIRTPGVIEIRPHHTEPVETVGVIHACRLGNIRKRAVAVVMKQRVAGAFQPPGTTLHVQATVFAGGLAAEVGEIVEMKIDIVGHEEIDETITVIVAKSGARRPATVGNTGFGRHIRKRAIAVIPV